MQKGQGKGKKIPKYLVVEAELNLTFGVLAAYSRDSFLSGVWVGEITRLCLIGKHLLKWIMQPMCAYDSEEMLKYGGKARRAAGWGKRKICKTLETSMGYSLKRKEKYLVQVVFLAGILKKTKQKTKCHS